MKEDKAARVDHTQYAAPLATASTAVAGSDRKLSGKEIRKGTGDVLKDLDYALRFVDGDSVAGVLGLELDFINRALRVAKGEIVQLRKRREAPDAALRAPLQALVEQWITLAAAAKAQAKALCDDGHDTWSSGYSGQSQAFAQCAADLVAVLRPHKEEDK